MPQYSGKLFLGFPSSWEASKYQPSNSWHSHKLCKVTGCYLPLCGFETIFFLREEKSDRQIASKKSDYTIHFEIIHCGLIFLRKPKSPLANSFPSEGANQCPFKGENYYRA